MCVVFVDGRLPTIPHYTKVTRNLHYLKRHDHFGQFCTLPSTFRHCPINLVESFLFLFYSLWPVNWYIHQGVHLS
jgi:hypothetical protein